MDTMATISEAARSHTSVALHEATADFFARAALQMADERNSSAHTLHELVPALHDIVQATAASSSSSSSATAAMGPALAAVRSWLTTNPTHHTRGSRTGDGGSRAAPGHALDAAVTPFASTPALDGRTLVLRGWLRKAGHGSLTLAPRWAVLDGHAGCLFYYTGPDEGELKGVLQLRGARIRPVRPGLLGLGSTGWAFEVAGPEPSQPKVHQQKHQGQHQQQQQQHGHGHGHGHGQHHASRGKHSMTLPWARRRASTGSVAAAPSATVTAVAAGHGPVTTGAGQVGPQLTADDSRPQQKQQQEDNTPLLSRTLPLPSRASLLGTTRPGEVSTTAHTLPAEVRLGPIGTGTAGGGSGEVGPVDLSGIVGLATPAAGSSASAALSTGSSAPAALPSSGTTVAHHAVPHGRLLSDCHEVSADSDVEEDGDDGEGEEDDSVGVEHDEEQEDACTSDVSTAVPYDSAGGAASDAGGSDTSAAGQPRTRPAAAVPARNNRKPAVLPPLPPHPLHVPSIAAGAVPVGRKANRLTSLGSFATAQGSVRTPSDGPGDLETPATTMPEPSGQQGPLLTTVVNPLYSAAAAVGGSSKGSEQHVDRMSRYGHTGQASLSAASPPPPLGSVFLPDALAVDTPLGYGCDGQDSPGPHEGGQDLDGGHDQASKLVVQPLATTLVGPSPLGTTTSTTAAATPAASCVPPSTRGPRTGMPVLSTSVPPSRVSRGGMGNIGRLAAAGAAGVPAGSGSATRPSTTTTSPAGRTHSLTRMRAGRHLIDGLDQHPSADGKGSAPSKSYMVVGPGVPPPGTATSGPGTVVVYAALSSVASGAVTATASEIGQWAAAADATSLHAQGPGQHRQSVLPTGQATVLDKGQQEDEDRDEVVGTGPGNHAGARLLGAGVSRSSSNNDGAGRKPQDGSANSSSGQGDDASGKAHGHSSQPAAPAPVATKAKHPLALAQAKLGSSGSFFRPSSKHLLLLRSTSSEGQGSARGHGQVHDQGRGEEESIMPATSVPVCTTPSAAVMPTTTGESGDTGTSSHDQPQAHLVPSQVMVASVGRGTGPEDLGLNSQVRMAPSPIPSSIGPLNPLHAGKGSYTWTCDSEVERDMWLAGLAAVSRVCDEDGLFLDWSRALGQAGSLRDYGGLLHRLAVATAHPDGSTESTRAGSSSQTGAGLTIRADRARLTMFASSSRAGRPLTPNSDDSHQQDMWPGGLASILQARPAPPDGTTLAAPGGPLSVIRTMGGPQGQQAGIGHDHTTAGGGPSHAPAPSQYPSPARTLATSRNAKAARKLAKRQQQSLEARSKATGAVNGAGLHSGMDQGSDVAAGTWAHGRGSGRQRRHSATGPAWPVVPSLFGPVATISPSSHARHAALLCEDARVAIAMAEGSLVRARTGVCPGDAVPTAQVGRDMARDAVVVNGAVVRVGGAESRTATAGTTVTCAGQTDPTAHLATVVLAVAQAVVAVVAAEVRGMSGTEHRLTQGMPMAAQVSSVPPLPWSMPRALGPGLYEACAQAGLTESALVTTVQAVLARCCRTVAGGDCYDAVDMLLGRAGQGQGAGHSGLPDADDEGDEEDGKEDGAGAMPRPMPTLLLMPGCLESRPTPIHIQVAVSPAPAGAEASSDLGPAGDDVHGRDGPSLSVMVASALSRLTITATVVSQYRVATGDDPAAHGLVSASGSQELGSLQSDSSGCSSGLTDLALSTATWRREFAWPAAGPGTRSVSDRRSFSGGPWAWARPATVALSVRPLFH